MRTLEYRTCVTGVHVGSSSCQFDSGCKALTFRWYDGKRKPSSDLVGGKRVPSNGMIIVGDKGTLFLPRLAVASI